MPVLVFEVMIDLTLQGEVYCCICTTLYQRKRPHIKIYNRIFLAFFEACFIDSAT